MATMVQCEATVTICESVQAIAWIVIGDLTQGTLHSHNWACDQRPSLETQCQMPYYWLIRPILA